jgi:ammonium transporter, Amt family
MKLNGLIPTAATGAATAALYAWTALPAFAQDAAPAAPPPKLDSGDTAWMLTSVALVLMMTIPGLALFYGGMVRKKNVLSVLMQCFVTTCLVTVLWAVVAYSLAFRTNPDDFYNAYIGGFDRVLLAGMGKDTLAPGLTIPESVFMCFQMTFAIITPALIIGSIVDRMKFSALVVFMSLWLILVYAPIAHWVWGGGFLAKSGVLDFAGGTVVHINAGIAGLMAALVLGRRTGYRTENMAPFNLVLTVIGASLLWVGWFGFNAGSATASNGLAGSAMTVTQIATAMAALAWMFSEWLVHGKPSVLGIASGAVAGLVAITPASGFVDTKGALVIGAAAGVGCYIASTGLKRLLGYDDSLDVFGVHCIGGIIGALLTGVFAVQAIGGTAGVLEGNFAQLPIQAYGVLCTLVWSGGVSLVLMLLLRFTIGVRVSEAAEVEGLDLALHGETVQ